MSSQRPFSDELTTLIPSDGRFKGLLAYPRSIWRRLPVGGLGRSVAVFAGGTTLRHRLNLLPPTLFNRRKRHVGRHQSPFARLIKNTGVLIAGNVFSSALSLIASIIAARTLTVEPYGILAGIIAYVTIVEKLTSFESWQALIKYGSQALEEGKPDKFGDLLKFGYTLDISTAIGGAIISASLFTTLSEYFDWGQDHALLVVLYSITIAFSIRGSPTALLRLKEQYFWFSLSSSCAAALRLLASLTGAYLGAGLCFFVAVFALSDVIGKLTLNLAFIHVVYKDKKLAFQSARVRGISRTFPGIWRFVALTNLNSTIRMTSREADVLIIGSVAGPSAMGFYKLAKQLASIPVKLSDPLYQAIFPELARLKSSGNDPEMARLSIRAAVTAGTAALACWIVFAVFSREAIELLAGESFIPAANIAVWYFFALVIAIASFPLTPFMLAIGKPHVSLWVYTVSTIVYFFSIRPLIDLAGLPGAGIAYVLFYLVWSAFTLSSLIIIQKGTARHQPDASN